MTKNDGSSSFRTFVTKRFGFNFTRSRINNSDLLVFARRHQLRPVPVETSAEDDVRMTVNVDQNLAGSNVPNDDLIIGSCR